MMKAIIIDDELHCISSLVHDLKMFCPQVEVVDTCNSAKDGLLSIKKNQPDLVFLDIEMPVINGFELLEILGRDISFQLVFTTAYEQFATRAFRVSAIDYLLKPIDGRDLAEAVGKAAAAIAKHKPVNEQVMNLMENNRLPAEQQKIAFPARDGYDFVSPGEIIYCKADGSYTRIILNDNRTLMISKPLGEIENLLPQSLFERIHHSCLINLSLVRQFKKTDGASMIMYNGDQLMVSRSKRDHLMQRLGIK